LLDAQRADDAQTELRASLQAFASIAPPDGLHPFSAGPRLALGKLLAAQQPHSVEALKLLHEAVKLREQTYGSEDPLSAEARAILAQAMR